MKRIATQRAPDNTARDEESLEEADRLAVERGEDDGMIVHQDMTSTVHNRKDLNAITTR